MNRVNSSVQGPNIGTSMVVTTPTTAVLVKPDDIGSARVAISFMTSEVDIFSFTLDVIFAKNPHTGMRVPKLF